MSAWPTILLVAAVTFAIKAVGPAVLGGRALAPKVTGVIALLAAALLSALVVTNALADGRSLHVGADTAGVGVAALLLWRRAPVLLVVLAVAVTTALLRASGLLD